MIVAASLTLARLLSQGLTQISPEQISFEHPRLWQKHKPGLNLYCYHVQEAEGDRSSSCRWFDLTFLVSVADYTCLGEQHLLSDILVILSQYQLLPDGVLDHTLRGNGAIRMRFFAQAPTENIQFWTVLCVPLQLALHVTLTVPYRVPVCSPG